VRESQQSRRSPLRSGAEADGLVDESHTAGVVCEFARRGDDCFAHVAGTSGGILESVARVPPICARKSAKASAEGNSKVTIRALDRHVMEACGGERALEDRRVGEAHRFERVGRRDDAGECVESRRARARHIGTLSACAQTAVAKRPPGLSARCIARTTPSRSGNEHEGPSAERGVEGMRVEAQRFGRRTRRRSTLVRPAASIRSRAIASIPGDIFDGDNAS